jgi:hypothetical protein
VSAHAPIRIHGRGNSIAISQMGCQVNLLEDDVLALFDAVSEVIAENRMFREKHESRHRPHKNKSQGKHDHQPQIQPTT